MSDADEVERLRLHQLIMRAIEEQAHAHAKLALKGAGLPDFLDAQKELEDLRAEMEAFEARIAEGNA